MRKILIVGAGQSGLALAHGLLDNGYDVTVITGRSTMELRRQRATVTQFTLPSVLEHERKMGLDFWSVQAPKFEGVRMSLFPPAPAPPAAMSGRFGGAAISVDSRVKMADWLEYFEDRGGKVVIHGVTLTDLDYFSRMFDLIVIAVGGGELGALFETDPSRDSGAHPRVFAQTYVSGVQQAQLGDKPVAEVFTAAEAGEVYLIPALTAEGPCHSLLVMDTPGGPMGQWPEKMTPEEQLRISKQIMSRYMPEGFERVRAAEVAGARDTMVERLTPSVRHPVGRLPSGGLVLGIADVVVTTDPISAQGWSNSTVCASTYLERIVAHGDRPFDEHFMRAAFDQFWDYARHGAMLAEMIFLFWDPNLPEHLREFIQAALSYPEIGDRWAEGLNYPPSYQEWLFDPVKLADYLDQLRAAQ